jgi:DNA polymerase III subunit gamma/tau
MSIDNTVNFTGLVQRGDKAINERYRPCTFHELIGNEATKKSLAGWVERGDKRSRSILLVGGSGDGKTTTARILAMGLNCEKGDTVNPCCECPSCKSALAGEAMHITEYNMSALSKKEDADEIVNSMYNSSFTGRNNVAILDEIQGMSSGSQNLMLKMLENPPSNTYVILATTDPQKILKTVKTRCEQYEFKNPSIDDIKYLLASVVKQEMPEMNVEQRKQILEASKGLGFREILMKLEKFIKGGGTGNIEEMFQADYMGIAQAILKGNYQEVLKQIEKSGELFEVEAARRLIRTFLCNQIEYSIRSDDVIKAQNMLKAFRVFDKGFYTDPNPIPTFKADLFEACLFIKNKI